MGAKQARHGWTKADESKVRVLVECPPAGSPSIVATVLEREGYEVRTCEGPSAHPCDLLTDGTCGLVDGADVVVNLLGSDPIGRDVLRAASAIRRPPAVVAEMTEAQAVALAVECGGCVDPSRVTVVHPPLTRRALVDAIDESLATQQRSIPIWGDGFC
jgi:hypothetical protein